tara:strand:+ start:270 stop:1043 length:774 start_codon:yes stop_codon:yes gene_type:complete
MTNKEKVWQKIISDLNLRNHNFSSEPFYVEHKKIKKIVSTLTEIPNNIKEIRVLGSQIRREKKPNFFRENNLLLLPASNKEWVIIKGDGYFDIPTENIAKEKFESSLKFELDTLTENSTSESRYIAETFAKGIIQDFTGQDSLYLTLSGRKYASFNYNAYGFDLSCDSVQIEIDSGYESEDQVILIEAKAAGKISNEVIRQLYFPRRYVSSITNKKIRNIFFVVTDKGQYVTLYEYDFKSEDTYESIFLVDSKKYKF